MEQSKLYPQNEAGKRFCHFFSHRYTFILGNNLGVDWKPDWQTVKKYPLEHRNLWNRYRDENCFVGVSFNKETHYLMADIDRNSSYHPLNDEQEFKRLMGAFEDIGMVDYLVVQSSFSEGIHVYFFFPEKLPTYYLAKAVRLMLLHGGFDLKDGQLEIFPNQKAHGGKGKRKTQYKAHRLPLQQGSFILDDDYCPYSDSIETYLDLAQTIAQRQDMETIQMAITAAKETSQFWRMRGGQIEATKFYQDLEEQIQEGWSDHGQTNELLRIIGTVGRVFEGLSGEDLVKYIANKARSLPGYKQFCRHHHNIQQRAKDWARCVEKFYYPYGTKPARDGTFCKMIKEGAKENIVNSKRQKDAYDRISQAFTHLKETRGILPKKIGELKTLLLETVSNLFGTRPSDKTLRKYRHLWHPKYRAVDLPIDGGVKVSETLIDKQPKIDDKPAIDLKTQEKIPTSNKQILNDTDEPKSEKKGRKSGGILELKESPPEQDKAKLAEEKSEQDKGEKIDSKASPVRDTNKSYTPPKKEGKSAVSEKPLNAILDKELEKKSYTPLYKKVKLWVLEKTKLISQSFSSGLVTFDEIIFDQKKNKNKKITKESLLQSIEVGEEVVVVNCDHSSCLLYPEDEDKLLVYIAPVSKLKSWHDGIAILAKFLTEKTETG